jgi:nicotinamidase-related amidase
MNTALLVIDVQKGLVEYLPPYRQTELLQNVAALLDKARSAGVAVIYVQHQDEELIPGTRVWEIAAEISPRNGEPVVAKTYRDSFRETRLDQLLNERNVQHVMLCGMQTEFCIDATLREAERRGYRVTLIGDAHATYDVPGCTEDQTRAQVHRVAQGIANVIRSADVAFGETTAAVS